MSEIHESGEDYLEAILCIQKLNGAARSVDVSKRLGVSKPSVSRAIGILIENEYIYIACKNDHDIDDDVKKGIERWMENNKDA